MSPTSSFLRFVLGFLTFIGVSFAVTVSVDRYIVQQEREQQAAAAISALVGQR